MLKIVNQNLIKFILFVFIIVCGLINFNNAHPKGDTLRKYTTQAESSVIYFTAQSFKEYVLKHPRPYDVVLLYTLKVNCNFCDMIKEEFNKVAYSYYDVNAYKPDLANKKRAVVFGVLHYSEDSNDIFKSLKLPSQTTIMYTSPHDILVNDKNDAYIKYDEETIITYRDRRDYASAHKILEFVNNKSKRSIELKKNPILFLFYFVCFCGILAFGHFLYQHFKWILLSPYLWIIGSFAIYIICIGGIVYNIIHGAPFAKYDRYGNIVEFIHSGQRSQYAGEGLLLSSLFVLVGTLLYSLNWINKIPGYWNHKMAFILVTLSIAIACRTITSLYRVKASWYGPEFAPPHNYIKGPLLKDQGNAF
jgi:hypothetical protein